MDLNSPHPERGNRRVTRLPIRFGWRNPLGVFNLISRSQHIRRATRHKFNVISTEQTLG